MERVAGTYRSNRGSFYDGYGESRPSESRADSREDSHYNSDPSLVVDEGRSEGQSSGRRSAIGMDNFSSRDYASKGGLGVEERNDSKKVKKKKLKKLKNFMHVFLGGLRHQVSSDYTSSEQYFKNEANQQQRQAGSSPTPTSPDLNTGLGGNPQRKSSLPPSASVPPSSALACRGAEVPGLCGLHNHGNTCFMNAIVQCLSNTDQLAEYIVTDLYKNDVNKHRFASRNVNSSRGEITEQFALLLKCLWNGQYDPRVTGQFKEVIGKYGSQYEGSSQHDAQEFFLWLLDNVHEDLNLGGKRKYRPLKVGVARPLHTLATPTPSSCHTHIIHLFTTSHSYSYHLLCVCVCVYVVSAVVWVMGVAHIALQIVQC